MKKIIAVRFNHPTVTSFDKPGLKDKDGKDKTVQMSGQVGQSPSTIEEIINKANDNYELKLLIIDGKVKSIVPSSRLVGEILEIGMKGTGMCVEIEAADKFNICDEDGNSWRETNEGALPSKNSLKQLRKVSKATKGVSKAGRTKSQGNLLDKNIETETKTIYNESSIKRFNDFGEIDECLVPENSLRQLKDVRKISKSTDIGEKTKLKGPNMEYDRSALDGKIETYEEYAKSQKGYVQKNNKWVVK